MPAFTATNTTLAGLGMSFDSISVTSSFSSGEETFDTLFSDEGRASSDNTDGSPPVSPMDEEPADWRLMNAQAPWHTESDEDVNFFEPYRGVPEVEHFMPWPTSPELTTAITSWSVEATPRPVHAAHSAPLPRTDRGYETDNESPRARRQQRRRDAHRLPRRQRLLHLNNAQPIPEMRTLEDIQRLAAACSSPASDEDTSQDIGLPTTPDDPDTRIDAEDLAELFDVPLVDDDDEPEGEVEQDITDCLARPVAERAPSSDMNAFQLWDSDSNSDSDLDLDSDSDSSDSDVDRYFYDSDGNVDEAALARNGRPHGPIHYTKRAVSPSAEASTTTTTHESEPESHPAPVPAHVGLGIWLGVTPFPYPITTPSPPRRSPEHDEFETIDLSDDAPAPVPTPTPASPPSAPVLRPCPTVESPSPIMLGPPPPSAAFRQFDGLLCLTAQAFRVDEPVVAEARTSPVEA
ncbi:hypothetical protein BC628DRAFT_40543 [Trametes gibbosa]|nr:hypothetical protein BC628DRAFT_40543 [Trametes gibbosa]